jgi:Spy/CpxP family protein refolding chaperone
MKINSLLKTTLGGLLATSLITACGNLSTPLNSASLTGNSLQTQSFNAGIGEHGPKSHPGGPGAEKGMNKGEFEFADLNLTDEQKSALQTLREANKPEQAVAPDANKQAEIKTLIETAFLSDSFDTTSLESQLMASAPNHDAQLQKQAEVMIKSWQILTADQQAQVKAKQAERAAKMSEIESQRPVPPNDSQAKGTPGIEGLTQQLNLSAEQQASLTAAFEANKPDFASKKTTMNANREAIQAEIESSSPSVDNLVALLKASQPENANPGLAQLAQLHSILTAEQRQSLVTAGLPFGHGGPGGLNRPGGPGGNMMNGPIGHGGGFEGHREGLKGGPGGMRNGSNLNTISDLESTTL